MFGVSPEPVHLPPLYLSDGGDPTGRIYKLENDDLSEYYKRYRGRIYNLAVAPNGTVYFSDNNDRVPANLYKVVELHPKRMFTDSGSIAGLAFIPGGYLLYTDWRQSINSLGLPGLIASSPTYSFGGFKWLSDVEPAKTENRTTKPPGLQELLRPLPKVEGIRIE